MVANSGAGEDAEAIEVDETSLALQLIDRP
jgi:hypothetical protein